MQHNIEQAKSVVIARLLHSLQEESGSEQNTDST